MDDLHALAESYRRARIERRKRHSATEAELVEAYRQAGIDYDEDDIFAIEAAVVVYKSRHPQVSEYVALESTVELVFEAIDRWGEWVYGLVDRGGPRLGS